MYKQILVEAPSIMLYFISDWYYHHEFDRPISYSSSSSIGGSGGGGRGGGGGGS